MTELNGQISLADYLDTTEPSPSEEDAEYAVPSGDDAEASKLLRRLSVTGKQITANSKMAEGERAKISQWEALVNEPLQSKALWLRSLLEGYALHEREASDRKTISLPFGTLSTRPANPSWSVADKDAFIAWAKDQEAIVDLYRTKEEPSMTVIKGAFHVDDEGNACDPITGELVPGVKVTAPATPFTPTVKPN